jgi:hypothetical protein
VESSAAGGKKHTEQASRILPVARDPEDPEIRAAWSREIERRVREIDEGTAELLDWDDVRAELFADE